jgi:hypothetical protein
MSLTLQQRAQSYNITFPKFAIQAPLMATERWLYGIWMIGNNYQNAMQYYGEYPPSYLKRVYSLFPDIKSEEILHLFSGSLVETEKGDRFDINPTLHPTYLGNAEHLSNIVKKKYKLICADPPYTQEDAEHYGQPLVNRNTVVKECAKILEKDGYLVWLDMAYPMFSKQILQLIGTIGIIRSTNHRFRVTLIWQKVGDVE